MCSFCASFTPSFYFRPILDSTGLWGYVIFTDPLFCLWFVQTLSSIFFDTTRTLKSKHTPANSERGASMLSPCRPFLSLRPPPVLDLMDESSCFFLKHICFFICLVSAVSKTAFTPPFWFLFSSHLSRFFLIYYFRRTPAHC